MVKPSNGDQKKLTVAEMLSVHDGLRNKFIEAQAENLAAQQAYQKAKTEIVDFNKRFGAVIKLFSDKES